MYKTILTTLSCIISFATAAQQSNDSAFIKNITDYALTNGKAYDNLRYLCKQIGHRLSGSAAMYKAEAWGLNTLKELKADTTYYQQCMVPQWQRGGKETVGYKWTTANGNKFRQVEKELAILALGNSMGSNNNALVGELLLVNNFEELQSNASAIKGKIVFFNYPFNQTYVQTFKGYSDAVKYRGGGASIAAKYGAVGTLVRSVSTAPDNHPHTGSLRYNDSFPKIPAFAVGPRDADELAQLYTTGKLTITIRNKATFANDTPAHNVIGEIKGSLYPNKIITIGGHLDSWDVGEGAHDDGAGVVHSMEVINLLKKLDYKPKHTIRVVLFANEENGLRGGNKYAELAEKNNEEHIAAIESDAGGFSPRGFGGNMSDAQYMKFSNWLPLLKDLGITAMNRGGGGADIGPLYTKFKTPVIGLSPDSQRYFDLHHAKTDVFEAVNKRELHLGAAAITALVYLIDKYGL